MIGNHPIANLRLFLFQSTCGTGILEYIKKADKSDLNMFLPFQFDRNSVDTFYDAVSII